ncbi:unnamed protein product [Ranitomeya imitator]|uniref:Proteasome subunit beta type-3 n=1 Tax=Ranitomeya imitator TaxID=111125 RepID=A0ABN9KRZ4_9NEOB|nr:unnamed protein product [Ranitomeya imitator]
MIRSVPVGQFLRLRRICSSDADFEARADELRQRFVARGYSRRCYLYIYRYVPYILGQEWPKLRHGPRHRWSLESCLCDSSPATTLRFTYDHGQVISLVVIVEGFTSLDVTDLRRPRQRDPSCLNRTGWPRNSNDDWYGKQYLRGARTTGPINPWKSIMSYNGGAVMAMRGKNCVAIAADKRYGVQAQMVTTDFQKIFPMGERLYIGLAGLATDVQTVSQRLKFRLNLYELKEGRQIKPKTFMSMVSNLLYERRFGPYYVEPVIAGLDPKTFEPFICSLDLIGCPMVTEDFVVSGTCSEQMYGMCESLWEPDLLADVTGFLLARRVEITSSERPFAFKTRRSGSRPPIEELLGSGVELDPAEEDPVFLEPEDLFETISQAMLNAVDRDAISGMGVVVHIIKRLPNFDGSVAWRMERMTIRHNPSLMQVYGKITDPSKKIDGSADVGSDLASQSESDSDADQNSRQQDMSLLTGKPVRIQSDNATAVAYINHQGGTRSKQVMREVAKILRSEFLVGALFKAVESLRLSGVIVSVPEDGKFQGFFSNLFIVPKKDGAVRPILDLKLLNSVSLLAAVAYTHSPVSPNERLGERDFTYYTAFYGRTKSQHAAFVTVLRKKYANESLWKREKYGLHTDKQCDLREIHSAVREKSR